MLLGEFFECGDGQRDRGLCVAADAAEGSAAQVAWVVGGVKGEGAGRIAEAHRDGGYAVGEVVCVALQELEVIG